MSQNIIDVGAAPNDGTGDPLRNAFIAINENFDQIWSNGPVNSNVRIANNSITTTNINGNLVLAPSGIGITQVKSSIVPAVDNVYDLGSPSARFNTIYLGSGGLELAGNLNVDYYFGNGRFLSGVLAAAAPNIQFGGTTVNIPSANANVVFTVNNIQSLEVGAAQTIFFRPIVSNSTVSTSGNITSAANVNAVGISATTVAAAGLAVSANTTTGNLSVVGSVTANTVNSTGNITFAPGGNLVFSNAVVNWLANPVQAQDAATKFYVDSVAQGLDVKASVLLATATTLPTYVYSNGTDGVGATITATTNGLLSIDSTAVSANARVLVKNEVGLNQPYNGIYIVTDTGNATAQFVLTRSTDFDLPSEIPSAFTFIETGATNADTGYVCITNSPVTIGTTNIVWQQFSGAGSYTAGIGLSLNGTQFFISNTGVTANTYGSSSSIPVLTVDPRGQITNATTASINAPAGLVTGDTLSSNVLISSLTAVGTLSQLSVSGNVDANNLNSLQVVSAAGNVIGGNITTAGVLTASGNVVGGNISTAGLVTATGNIVGGNIATAGVITATGNVISAGNVNAANVNSSGNISAVGNIAAGNVVSSGRISASGNVESAANINGANVNASGNVSVTGNVNASNFSTTGNIAVGNLSITGIISATGNIVSSANVNAANVNSTGNISATGNVNSGNITTTGSITAAQNISATGNVSASTLNSSGLISAVGNVNTTANVNAGNINATGTISSTGNISATGNLQGNNLSVTNLVNASGNVTGANITTNGLITAVGNITSTSNVAAGNIVSQGLVTAVGNIVTSANVNAANLNVTESVVAVGNVVGGNLTTGGRVTATGNIVSSANISGGNLLSTGIVSATSNVIGGNITTGGRVDATGNITGGNLTTTGTANIATLALTGSATVAGSIAVSSSISASSFITATGNVIGGNITTTGLISATGNITGNYFIGNGSQLSGLSTSSISNGNSNVAIATANGNVTITAAGGNTWTFDTTGNLTLPGATAGETIATQSGYITVGNLLIGQGGSLFNSNNDSWALYGNLSDPGTVIFIPSDADAGNGIPLYIESQQSNVEIRSGSSTWNFGNTSNLTLPLGGIVYETSIPGGALTGNTIALKPQGGTNNDQQLLVYPTALGADANHLHLTTGNLYNTELFLGNDNLYVKLANTGNIVINSNDDVGNTAQWTFDYNGVLTVPASNSVPGRISTETTAQNEKGFDLRISAGNTDGCSRPGGDMYLSAGVGYNGISHGAGNVNIVTGDRYGNINGNIWRFDSSGALTLPLGNIKIKGTVGNSIAFGLNAGQISQGTEAVAIGSLAGNNRQGNNSVAIGNTAGAGGSVSTNYVSGAESPSTTLVVTSTTGIGPGMIISGTGFFGNITVVTVTNLTTLEISASAGFTPSGTLTFTGSQGDEAVAIGQSAGSTNQGSGAVAVGGLAGYNLQGDNAVAIGGLAGNNSQGTQAVAVGLFAGQEDQGQFSVAIGGGAGQQTQGEESVAIGAGAGSTVQGNAAVAIGGGAGAANQRINSVAIGASAGAGTQGQYAVAIGASAGYTNQGNNSIILNATGANLDQTTANTFTVAPVRNDVANTAQVMFYNTTSKEITYGNTISVAGNITSGNLNSPTLNNSGNVSVVAGGNTWTFGTNGNLTVPGPISGLGFSKLDFTTYGANSAYLTTTADDTTALFMGAVTAELYANTDVSIRANTGGTSQNWIFGQDGALTAPGNLNGVNVNTGIVSATGNVNSGNVNTAKVASTGGITIASGGSSDLMLDAGGNINVDNNYINNLVNPVQNQDAATKIYVDNLVTTAISYHEAVFAATISNLATTTGGTIAYAQPNGAGNGVGATITTTGSFNLIDTANVQTLGTRILVKNEGNAALNGIYTWSNATVITRSTDADTYGVANANTFSINDYFFVSSGNVNKGSAYIVDAPSGTITFGTSNIQFAQFSSTQVYTAGNGIDVSGTVITARVDNTTTAFDGAGNIIVKAGANLTTPNIGAATGTSLSVTGNVTAGNFNTVGAISASGNILSSNVFATGTVSGNIVTGNSVSASGNVTGANINTNGLISAAGNVISGNVSTGNIVAANVNTGYLLVNTSAGANITGGNLTLTEATGAGGAISAQGNISGANLNATNISLTGNVLSNLRVNGNVNVSGVVDIANSLTADSLLVDTVGGITANSGNITINQITGQGGYLNAVGANLSANIAAGNVNTGNISLTGNVLSNLNVNGNVDIAGTVGVANSFTADSILVDTVGGITANGGNIVINQITGQGGYLNALGANLSANLVAGNVNTGNISLTGNVLSNLRVNGNVGIAGIVDIANSLTVDSILVDTVGGIVANGGNITINQITGQGGNLNAVGISVSGNISGNNITLGNNLSTTGNITAGYFIGDGSQLTNLTIAAGSQIENGNSNVIVAANGNVSVGTYGTIPAVFANTGLYTTGLISATGNVDVGSTLNVTSNAAITGNISGGNISASGNITGTYFLGNGSLLSGIITSVANINNGTSNLRIDTAGGNIQANVAGTANIFTINASGIQTSGNASANNLSVSNVANIGVLSVAGNISANGVVTVDGNVTAANLISNGTVSAQGNVIGGNINTAGVVSATGNIVSVANVSGGNILSSLLISAAGNVTGANITSNGAVIALGNVTGGNVNSDGRVSAAGNIVTTANVTGGNLLTSGVLNLTGGTPYNTATLSGGNIILNNGAGDTPGLHFYQGNNDNFGIDVEAGTLRFVKNLDEAGGSAVGRVDSNGNIIAVGQLQGASASVSGNVTGGNIITGGFISATGNITGNYFFGNGSQLSGIITSVANINNGTSNIRIETSGGNIQANVGGTANVWTLASTGQYVSGEISASGNITGGNVTTGGLVTATGNIVSTANVTGGNVTTSGIVTASGNIVSTANVTGGNLTTAGLVTATGNITSSSNIAGGNLSATTAITAGGNITGGNVFTGGLISATGNISSAGNITGNFFFGNGSQLSGIITSVANINNGNSNVRIDSAGGNVAANVGGTANVLVLANTGAYVTGEVSASGNITGNFFIGNGSQLTGLASGGFTTLNVIGNAASYVSGNVTLQASTTSGNLIPQAGNGIQMVGNATTNNLVISIIGSLNDGTIWGGGGDCELVTGSVVLPSYDNGSITVSPTSEYDLGELPQPTATTTFSDTPPTGAVVGDMWIDSDSGILYLYFNDGSGSQWAEMASVYSIDEGPDLGNIGANLIPSTNATYTLGNSSNRWLNAFVSSNVNTGNLISTGIVSATGNMSGGNIITTGLMSATGNVSGANIITTGLISATGNVSAGNINASGLISATGIVSANSEIVLNSYTGAPEGGQLILAYRGISGLTGQGNGTWNLDVNSSNVFRIFTQDASGTTSVPITITSNTLSVSGNISDSKGEIRLVPENAQTTTYTLTLTDHGKYISSNANVAVPNSIFSSGQSVTIYNNSASSITIVQNTGVTMYQVGTATTGNRTLAQRGLATVFCVGVNIFVITGGGLS